MAVVLLLGWLLGGLGLGLSLGRGLLLGLPLRANKDWGKKKSVSFDNNKEKRYGLGDSLGKAASKGPGNGHKKALNVLCVGGLVVTVLVIL
jgi:hypothetical protein